MNIENIGRILLLLLAAYASYAFCRKVYSGQIEFGRGRVVKRQSNPVGFWLLVAVGIALFSYTFACLIGDVCIGDPHSGVGST